MMLSLFAVLLAAAGQNGASTYTLEHATKRLAVSDCTTAPDAIGCPGREQARYRLHVAGSDPDNAKRDALAEDGRQCALIGQTLCESHTRPIMRSGEDPADTIAASFSR